MSDADNDKERRPTTVNDRSGSVYTPPTWMRFNWREFAFLLEDQSPEETRAMVRLMCRLWERGPMEEAEVRKVVRDQFDALQSEFEEYDRKLSIPFVEQGRAYAERLSRAGKRAGKASAEAKQRKGTKVNDRSTTVNDGPILSSSSSLSSSKSNSELKDKAREAKKSAEPVEAEVMIWPTFEDWWEAYQRKGSKKQSQEQWAKLKQSEKEAAMEHTPRYVAATPEARYRKDGQRYLRHRGWEDEITTNDKPTAQDGIDKYKREVAEAFARKFGITDEG